MILNTDGGARGNPGPGAAGVVLRNDTGDVVKQVGLYLGVCTNNEAEYKALALGLQTALGIGVKTLVCRLDSELVVNQVIGRYKIKQAHLKLLNDAIKKLAAQFEAVSFEYVPRAQNNLADKIVNEVLDAA
ncbi:MAG: Bifunctional RNase H/acid phosphatase [candidate division WWE3 bacterium GW2011_GWA1_46_21]|uniref:Bifunctional RNase H/acid phosphatase n=3 Tax=Katanobacteria TaxID=422282 RepID=A0A0G1SED6_UNCKA|nr:MAG: Bifunctional RNase H/acid phosphatase [candidate division WWE3 bacterium GW2011_GWA1_46_21]KKU50838.1 MAG: Bifunctional RNase H/acid phosphatase [candidate division WWE3 bacterium GW2011_GWC1_47_10]KKU57667.1 MAG: Bifunctional RNase H/acid phosphatase [candidate division WWE3 bacterium GW2011_GWB1_47_11]